MNTIESVIVKQEDWETWDDEEQKFVMNAPSNFFILNANGDRVFYMTRDRAKAQQQSDLDWGKGKYTVRAVKDSKGKTKSESGELSVRGVSTRKCFSPRLKGLK
jgi:hypothetical protein